MSIPFKNDDRPYQLLHYCDKLLGGPGLDKDLAQAFFCAAGVDDADALVKVLRYWLANKRSFPAPADVSMHAWTFRVQGAGGLARQFLGDDESLLIPTPQRDVGSCLYMNEMRRFVRQFGHLHSHDR